MSPILGCRMNYCIEIHKMTNHITYHQLQVHVQANYILFNDIYKTTQTHSLPPPLLLMAVIGLFSLIIMNDNVPPLSTRLSRKKMRTWTCRRRRRSLVLQEVKMLVDGV